MVKPYFETENGKLYHGDCLEIMKIIPDKSIDMILCDLPYGTTACFWDVVIPFEPLWVQYKRIVKDNAAIVLTGSQPFTTSIIMSNQKWFKYCLVWDKQRSCGSMLAKCRPLKYHEDIIIFCKTQTIYNPQMVRGPKQKKASGGHSENYGEISLLRYESSLYYPRSILEFKACHNMTGKDHPTQKPVDLFRYLILTYTNPGATILDNCIGSGTTASSAESINRKWIGIEKDENYCQKAAKRIRTETRQLTIT